MWTPARSIRVKVLGLVARGDSFLAMDVTGRDGAVVGVRPLGGTVEFGETREAALHREFAEELGCEIAIESAWSVFENIFAHEEQPGHEIVFVADISLLDPALYARDEIRFTEGNGESCRAAWRRLQELEAGGLDLYPSGLHAHLSGAGGGT